MKHYFIYLIILVIALTTTTLRGQQASGWSYLFDGKTTDSLRGYKMSGFPDKAWIVEDGALVAQTGVPNIDLVTKRPYKNFELTLDWKVSKAGNSGIFFYIDEAADKEAGNGNSPNWLDNFEMQLLDDINFNDTAAIRSAGSLYDLIAPTNKTLKPVGEYNQARLIVKNNHVEHWINGAKVVEYQIGSPELNKLISNSKFKDNPKFAKSTDGLIMIQHHGQKVWLKNIKVRILE
ncbi:3-keto-disaccharide hydrolase [Dyadobacter bucti]|uniref:3-keto-disaccharide hydrolase n=1 Tax=Dyadobacter bucti TaxID=2572203 RepID=UPI003F70784F